MEYLPYILIPLCLISIIMFIIIRAKFGGIMGLITKIVASLSLVIASILVLILTNNPKFAGFISIGLLFGLIGDILLDLKVLYSHDEYYLNGGMLAFGLGHICYAIAFTSISNTNTNFTIAILVPLILAVITTICIILLTKKMKFNFGKFIIPSSIYTLILSYMVFYTLILGIYGMTFVPFIAMLLFFSSDIILSFQYFKDKIKDKKLIILNHTLYYLSQLTILLCLFI